MKAAVRSLTGSIAMKENYSMPDSCGSKEVLVDVKAAGINPVDYKVSINVTSFPYFRVKLSCVCLMIAYRKKLPKVTQR